MSSRVNSWRGRKARTRSIAAAGNAKYEAQGAGSWRFSSDGEISSRWPLVRPGAGSIVDIVVVAVGIAAHASGGIAVALLASTNVVAGAGAELRAVEGFEETTAPDLARNGSESILWRGGNRGGVLPRGRGGVNRRAPPQAHPD